MFDPNTLATLATYSLPPRQSVPTNTFQDFTGGGYFYLDNQDRVVTSTTTKHILVIAETPGSPGFSLVHDYDLTSVVSSAEKITSALPDSHGLLWFVTKTDGVVGTLNLATGAIHAIHLGSGSNGEIENSFATDQNGGVYIDTNRKLYRFGAGPGGVPRIVWQVTYPNSGESKPGQVDDGTGTTPTVMPGGYVNITDNADPMDIMVYRTAAHPFRWVRRHGHRRRVALPRQVCRFPIFNKGASADENSIIAAGRSMIAEDNYGYTGPTSVESKTTTPGIVRVDLNANGRGCHRVWTSDRRGDADGRLEARARDRPRLHVHGRLEQRLVLDRARLPHRQGRLQVLRGHRHRLQQQLRRDLDQPERAPSTSGRSAGSSRCATAERSSPKSSTAGPRAD